MLKGYHDKDKLPHWAKPGALVWFPKGTTLRSMHPQKKGPYKASRRQKVQVNHILPGTSILLGSLYEDGTFYPQQRVKDVAHYAINFGCDRRVAWTDKVFEFLRNHENAEVRTRTYPKGHSINEVWLHTANPSVRWPGSGGYWVEADINDCHQAGIFTP